MVRAKQSIGKTACLTVCLSLCLMAGATSQLAAQVLPHRQAHAHNDYLHDRPLADALAHGFCSVEADIFLVKGQLLVAHTQLELNRDLTLERLYLQPLKQRMLENEGRIYRDGPPFGLLIDIKSEAESTYRELHTLLAKYASLLTRVEEGRLTPGAVNVVISGNRPQELIAAQATRYCGIDGRVGDLASDVSSHRPAHLLPMISDNWNSQFRWRGVGSMPESEKQKLLDIVERAHKQGRVVRFWATPESTELWTMLLEAQVDLINTDKLAELQKFLLARSKTQAR
ncbi:MAG: phosphatidylinositol-specific phospholipase C/glycerophosphodiester phosphodiesterase family protein [Pirellulaceae bacterium]|nr:phosphatidylinositol-specific phospholipase C/glycerophosphodiester phosphodiesterase family protein [Pirellulaceae bacterium]